jgi:hypothetical protein
MLSKCKSSAISFFSYLSDCIGCAVCIGVYLPAILFFPLLGLDPDPVAERLDRI